MSSSKDSELAAEFLDGPWKGQERQLAVELPFIHVPGQLPATYVRLARSHTRHDVVFYEWRDA